MPHLNRRGRKAAYEVTGNVLWLVRRRTNGPGSRSADPIASLKQSVTRLTCELERSERLKADIAQAIGARRYELCRRSMNLGVSALNRSLAAAQDICVGSLLRFVHTLAAAGAGERGGNAASAARLDSLAKSIGELEANLERARCLSRDMLAQCQRRDWRSFASAPGQLPH